MTNKFYLRKTDILKKPKLNLILKRNAMRAARKIIFEGVNTAGKRGFATIAIGTRKTYVKQPYPELKVDSNGNIHMPGNDCSGKPHPLGYIIDDDPNNQNARVVFSGSTSSSPYQGVKPEVITDDIQITSQNPGTQLAHVYDTPRLLDKNDLVHNPEATDLFNSHPDYKNFGNTLIQEKNIHNDDSF